MRLLPRKHVLQYDWLIHLFSAISFLFPIVFFISPTTANPWQLCVLFPAFLLQWYHGFWQNEKHVIEHFLAMSLIASWAMWMHWSGAVLFFYGQMFLLKLPRLWVASTALFVQALWVAFLGWYWQYPLTFIVGFWLLINLGGNANYLFFRHINAQRDLLIKQDELEFMTRERERERIARDLHDVLGHTLSSIALKAELAAKLLAADQRKRAEIEITEVAATARTALADVRQTVTGYRAGNLRSELQLAQHALAAADIATDIPEKIPRLISREMENLLSLVMREAVTNVIRHSKASHCRIQLFNRSQKWHLLVRDDGVGWAGQFGNGLVGMKERLAVHGGKMKIEMLSPGTSLTVTVDQILDDDLNAAY